MRASWLCVLLTAAIALTVVATDSRPGIDDGPSRNDRLCVVLRDLEARFADDPVGAIERSASLTGISGEVVGSDLILEAGARALGRIGAEIRYEDRSVEGHLAEWVDALEGLVDRCGPGVREYLPAGEQPPPMRPTGE